MTIPREPAARGAEEWKVQFSLREYQAIYCALDDFLGASFQRISPSVEAAAKTAHAKVLAALRDEIAGSTDCCDISSSSADAITDVIRRHARWRPIDTAPKETLVLCYDSTCDCPVIALTLTAVFTAVGTTRMMWRDYSGDSYQGYEPTHWMPLPDPPHQPAPPTI